MQNDNLPATAALTETTGKPGAVVKYIFSFIAQLAPYIGTFPISNFEEAAKQEAQHDSKMAENSVVILSDSIFSVAPDETQNASLLSQDNFSMVVNVTNDVNLTKNNSTPRHDTIL